MWRAGPLVSVAQDDLDACSGYTGPYRVPQ